MQRYELFPIQARKLGENEIKSHFLVFLTKKHYFCTQWRPFASLCFSLNNKKIINLHKEKALFSNLCHDLA